MPTYVPNLVTPQNVGDIFALRDAVDGTIAYLTANEPTIITEALSGDLAALQVRLDGLAAESIAKATADAKSPVTMVVIREHADGSQSFYGADTSGESPKLDPMVPVAAETILLVGATPAPPVPVPVPEPVVPTPDPVPTPVPSPIPPVEPPVVPTPTPVDPVDPTPAPVDPTPAPANPPTA